MAHRQQNVLRVVSKKQLRHAYPLARFLWLRAHRATRVWRIQNGRPHPYVFGSNLDAFDAMMDLAKATDRDFVELFELTLTCVDGIPFVGTIFLTMRHDLPPR